MGYNPNGNLTNVRSPGAAPITMIYDKESGIGTPNRLIDRHIRVQRRRAETSGTGRRSDDHAHLGRQRLLGRGIAMAMKRSFYTVDGRDHRGADKRRADQLRHGRPRLRDRYPRERATTEHLHLQAVWRLAREDRDRNRSCAGMARNGRLSPHGPPAKRLLCEGKTPRGAVRQMDNHRPDVAAAANVCLCRLLAYRFHGLRRNPGSPALGTVR